MIIEKGSPHSNHRKEGTGQGRSPPSPSTHSSLLLLLLSARITGKPSDPVSQLFSVSIRAMSQDGTWILVFFLSFLCTLVPTEAPALESSACCLFYVHFGHLSSPLLPRVPGEGRSPCAYYSLSPCPREHWGILEGRGGVQELLFRWT